MDVLWVILSVSCVLLNIEATVWNVVPSGLGFISKKNVGSIMPLEPSPHLLRKHPGLILCSFMKPVIQWALPLVSESIDVTWEFSLQSWECIVEGKSIGGEMNPS